MPYNDNGNLQNMVVTMIHETIEEISQTGKVDKDKLEILSVLIFEHIFHRTHNFVSDEMNEFRNMTPTIRHHKEFVKWSTPIVAGSEKLIKRLKQLGVAFSIIFTIIVSGMQLYKFVSDSLGYSVKIDVEKHIEKEVSKQLKQESEKVGKKIKYVIEREVEREVEEEIQEELNKSRK